MARWDWLTGAEAVYTRKFVIRVVLKASALFVFVNVFWVIAQPMQLLNQLTLYNTLFPGRERLPYSDNPADAYNLSIGSLDAMFAGHVIAADIPDPDEFQVAFIGDSSVWGVLLENDNTLAGCLNQNVHFTVDGRRLVAYNLGYPVLSVFKDALILDRALDYDVDAVVWLTTLQAFWEFEQLRHPIVTANVAEVRAFIEAHDLDIMADALPTLTGWERTLVGQRRELSDWLRFQVYGVGWWLTGDDYASGGYLGAPVRNLPDSLGILDQPQIAFGNLDAQDVLAWEVLQTGFSLAAEREVPMLLVNEPIYRSDGLNSDVRYNEYYPQWAYDEYRASLTALASANEWPFIDLWDAVPPTAFTDTPFHYDAEAVCDVSELMLPHILALAE